MCDFPFVWQDYVDAGILRPVQPTTTSGWTRYGAGRQFLPAATNYCTNPSFAGGDTGGIGAGWAAYNTVGGAVGYSIVAGRLDGYAQRILYTSAGDSSKGVGVAYMSSPGTFVSGDVATGSMYLKGAVVGARVLPIINAYTEAGAYVTSYAFAPVTPTAEWQRAYLTTPALGATVGKLRIVCQADQIDTGDTVDITVDDALLEKTAALAPYFDGSSPDCAWTGTAHASTSTRTVSALTIPVTLGATAWTVAGRYSGLWAHNDSAAHNLLTLYAGGDARATVYKHTDNKLYASVTDGTDTATSASAAQTLAANTLNTFVARSTWASTVNLSINGTASTQSDASAVAAQTITGLTIGGTPLGAVGPLILSPSNKGAAWQAAIEASGGAAFSDLTRLLRDFMAVGDYIMPLNGDSVGYRVEMAGLGSSGSSVFV